MTIQELKAKAVVLVEQLATAIKAEAEVVEAELMLILAKIKAHGQKPAETTPPPADSTATTTEQK